MKFLKYTLAIATFFLISILVNSCFINSDAPTQPNNTNTTPGSNLNTLPGNNIFIITAGGFTMQPRSTPGIYFKGTKGRCDITQNNYVVSVLVDTGRTSYLNVYFDTKPTITDSFTVEPYVEGDILPGKTQITSNIVSLQKTFHATKGKVYVTMLDSLSFKVNFNNLPTENLFNYTDTTFVKMSGELYCK